MKNTEKKSKKFQLETFEVAKIKNLKSVIGGNALNDDKTGGGNSGRFCRTIQDTE
jgi:hypothetical protein